VNWGAIRQSERPHSWYTELFLDPLSEPHDVIGLALAGFPGGESLLTDVQPVGEVGLRQALVTPDAA
jgi:hypothetical protein